MVNAKPYRKLAAIQQMLKAPKDKYNNFGKYKYRSCEGILEALKPILAAENCMVVMSDDIVDKCGKPYVFATATFIDLDDDITEPVVVGAFAREPLDKKGMDDAQITGSVSSYARKYALNAMFLIDDSQDPDTDEYKTTNEALAKKNAEPPKPPVSSQMPPQKSGEVVNLNKKSQAAKQQPQTPIDERRQAVSRIQELASKAQMTSDDIEFVMRSITKGMPEGIKFKDFPTGIYQQIIQNWAQVEGFYKQNNTTPFDK